MPILSNWCTKENFVNQFKIKKAFVDAFNDNKQLFKLIVLYSNKTPVVDRFIFQTVLKKASIKSFIISSKGVKM